MALGRSRARIASNAALMDVPRADRRKLPRKRSPPSPREERAPAPLASGLLRALAAADELVGHPALLAGAVDVVVAHLRGASIAFLLALACFQQLGQRTHATDHLA